MNLSAMERNACAYVAGWLEKKCNISDLIDPKETSSIDHDKDFVEFLSLGGLVIPQKTTLELVQMSLRFVKFAKYRQCCQKRLVVIIELIHDCYDVGPRCKMLYKSLANVLLHGMQNLDKDSHNNPSVQTSMKKARLSN